MAELIRHPHALDGVPRPAGAHAPAAPRARGLQCALDPRPAARTSRRSRVAARAHRRARGFDFIAEFAGPLPALVIMDMLGVPRERARAPEATCPTRWRSSSAARATRRQVRPRRAGHARDGGVLPRARSPRGRAAPQRDLLSELVHLDDDGDRLTDDELVATCVLLLFAGHETTTHHIANGLRRAAALPRGAGALQAQSGARAGRGGGAAALRRADRRAGAHRAGASRSSTASSLKTGRPRVPADERRQPRPARLSGARPRRPRARTACRT